MECNDALATNFRGNRGAEGFRHMAMLYPKKGYYRRKWPCCAGTLMQSVADYPIDLYFRDARGIYVNLYAASEVRWKANDIAVKLTQKTAYPESEQI